MAVSGLRRIFSNFFALLSWRLIMYGTGFVWVAYAARLLGVRDFGVYSAISALVGIFSQVPDMGVGLIIIRDVAKDHSKVGYFLGLATWLRIVFSLVATILVIILGPILFQERSDLLLLTLAAFTLWLNTVGNVGDVIMTGLERMKMASTLGTVASVFRTVGAIIILSLGLGLAGYYIFGLFAGLVLGIVYWWITVMYVARPKFRLESRDFWRVIKDGFPLAVSAFFYLVYYKIDQLMLTVFAGPREVGLYNTAVVILTAANEVIWVPYAIMVLPVISRLSQHNSQHLAWIHTKSVTILSIVSFAIAGGAVVTAPTLVSTIFSVEYSQSAIALQILMWSLPFLMIAAYAHRILIVMNKQVLYLWILVGGALFNIVINLAILPRYGYIGACWTSVISYGLVAIAMMVTIHNLGVRVLNWSELLKGLMVVVTVVFVAFVMGSSSVWLTLPACAVALVLASKAFRVVTIADLDHLRAVTEESTA